MNSNVTLRMEDKLLTKLRHKAVDQHMSLSAFVTATLKDLVNEDESYESHRKRALNHLKHGYHLGGAKFDREQLHAR